MTVVNDSILCPGCGRQYGHLFGCSLPKLQQRVERLLRQGYKPEAINKSLDMVLSTTK